MNIHCNTSGTAPDNGVQLAADDGRSFEGALAGNRCSFAAPNTINGGFWIRWMGKNQIRGVFPPYPREANYEGGLLDPPIPTLEFSAAPSGLLHVVRDRFFSGDHVWFLKGSTQFANLKQFITNGPWEAAVNQAIAGGGNLIRVLCSKYNNTGWDFDPAALSLSALKEYLSMGRSKKLKIQLDVWVDTRYWLDTPSKRRAFGEQIIMPAVVEYPDVALINWINEVGHGTQTVQASEAWKIPGVLCSRGSGLTDVHPPEPFMDFATASVRRKSYGFGADGGDGRGCATYSIWAWEEDYWKACPIIPQETDKPEGYAFNTDFANRMGAHARCGAGGTFHWSGGVNGGQMNPSEFACYEAFCRGVDGK